MKARVGFWWDVILDGVREGLRVSGRLLVVILPLYVVIDLLKGTPVVTGIASLFAPFMRAMDLPGEAAIPFAIAGLNNLYAAIAAAASLGLDGRQMTILGITLGISHNLIVEGGILRSAGTKGGLLTIYRVAASLIIGWLSALIIPGGG
jgi:spore maturation protein SpmB